MPELYPARVLESRPEAESQVLLTFEVPKEVWSEHIQPAQYVELVVGGLNPWQGTVANRPGRETFDFLVKDVGERSHRIAGLSEGDEVLVSRPRGPGFPVEAFRRYDVILMAAGVAICAMRAVIEEILLNRTEWGKVLVFYGERTADRFAFGQERERWRESGIEVHLSASRPAEGTYWRGHAGYVQEHILEVSPDLREAVVFAAGKDGMIDGIRRVLGRLGLPPNRLLLNID